MDETLKIADYPSTSLSRLAGKLNTITSRETQCPHSCSACKHRTKPWPHLEKQHLPVFGDVPKRKRRRNSSMGCWLGVLHMLSASSYSSSKDPGECNEERFAVSKPRRKYSSLAPWVPQAVVAVLESTKHQHKARDRRIMESFGLENPQNHQVQPSPQH